MRNWLIVMTKTLKSMSQYLSSSKRRRPIVLREPSLLRGERVTIIRVYIVRNINRDRDERCNIADVLAPTPMSTLTERRKSASKYMAKNSHEAIWGDNRKILAITTTVIAKVSMMNNTSL